MGRPAQRRAWIRRPAAPADPKRSVRFFDEVVRRRRAGGLYEAGRQTAKHTPCRSLRNLG